MKAERVVLRAGSERGGTMTNALTNPPVPLLSATHPRHVRSVKFHWLAAPLQQRLDVRQFLGDSADSLRHLGFLDAAWCPVPGTVDREDLWFGDPLKHGPTTGGCKAKCLPHADLQDAICC